jgi:trypsin
LIFRVTNVTGNNKLSVAGYETPGDGHNTKVYICCGLVTRMDLTISVPEVDLSLMMICSLLLTLLTAVVCEAADQSLRGRLLNVFKQQTDEPTVRIVGGIAATAGEYPYYAHVAGSALCGGSLIHPDIVLTAAHCKKTYENVTKVFLGSTDLLGADGAEQVAIDFIFPHPNYTPGSEKNDIMLVKLKSLSKAPLVSLNTNPSFPVDGQPVTAIGFGLTAESGSVSRTLQEVEINVVGFATCEAQLVNIAVFQDSQVCAGVAAGKKDTCGGDSGMMQFVRCHRSPHMFSRMAFSLIFPV